MKSTFSQYDADYNHVGQTHTHIPAHEVERAVQNSLGDKNVALFQGIPMVLFAKYHIDLAKPVNIFDNGDGGLTVSHSKDTRDEFKKSMAEEMKKLKDHADKLNHFKANPFIDHGASFRIDPSIHTPDPAKDWLAAQATAAAAKMAETLDKQILDGIIDNMGPGVNSSADEPQDEDYVDAIMDGWRKR